MECLHKKINKNAKNKLCKQKTDNRSNNFGVLLVKALKKPCFLKFILISFSFYKITSVCKTNFFEQFCCIIKSYCNVFLFVSVAP